MAPFDRPYRPTTFYWSAIVNIATSCTVFLSYLTLNNIVILKSGLDVIRVIQTGTFRKLGCSFLFAFYMLYLALFARQNEILVENRDYFIPPCI